MPKPLVELAGALNLQIQSSWRHIDITGICQDTRRLVPGDLFVAIRGQDNDGSDFIRDALERGAVAVVSEQRLELPVPVLVVDSARAALGQISDAFYDHPTQKLFTVGVTGTNGKTTVCHMTADLLGRTTTKLLSTIRNVGLATSDLTTLPSSITQQLAHDAVSQGLQNLVLEASSAGIAQDRVHGIDFDACVFTNLSTEHSHHHEGAIPYQRAKLKLFENLRSDAWAILNADDPLCGTFAAATPARVRTYGRTNGADLQLIDCHEEPRSSRFTAVDREGGAMSMHLPLPGNHNVFNAMAALSVGLVKGIPLDLLSQRLACVASVPGRGEFYCRDDGLVAVVDFAHNASSLQAMLQFLQSGYRRVIVVFGCPGDAEHAKRVDMGDVSGRCADGIVITSDNPKRENPHAIAEEIRSGMGRTTASVVFEPDRRQAIQMALSQAKAGDVVLVAGKGHETVQLVGDRRAPYSDSKVLRDLGFCLND